jgi:protein-L-isoaspartate(D-aspartate) O-methyltransferase
LPTPPRKPPEKAPEGARSLEDTKDFAHQRALMVERHVAARGVKDLRVLEAMRAVPRHLFVPAMYAAKAYGPGALPIGLKQTISQPYIVARMIELLELKGNEKVLEIGTGTGYQAVVLSKLAGKVFSIERLNDLALRAVELIRALKIYNVSVKTFDGTYGWSDQAPFERIIVAAAAPEVPEPLVQQLSRTGRMVIPVGPEGKQRLARVTRVGTRVQIEDCGSAEFVPLVGRFGWKE